MRTPTMPTRWCDAVVGLLVRLITRTAIDPQPWRATFLVTIEFETTVDTAGNAHVRTGSIDFVEQAVHPRAAEEQARATFAATSKSSIITVSVRAQSPHH